MTSVLLAISALLGIAILATDHNLWNYEPTHAYGLVVFVIIDIVAIGLAMLRSSRNILRLAGAWGFLFALIMVSDIYSGGATAIGLTPDQFASYLFGLSYYDNQHIAFLFPSLFVVDILAGIAGLFESRGIKDVPSPG